MPERQQGGKRGSDERCIAFALTNSTQKRALVLTTQKGELTQGPENTVVKIEVERDGARFSAEGKRIRT